MSFCYPKSVRLRSRRQFQRLSKHSKRYAGQWINADASQNKNFHTRLGITVSRHYGKSVHRNRFKRIVREAFRLCRNRLTPGLDLNIKPRKCAYNAKTSDIIADFLHLFGLPSI